MGQPVIHFEVVGRDGAKLGSYFSQLFGWEIDADNPMNYGVVQREGNTNADGAGIGGGVCGGPDGYEGHVTFYVEVPDVEAALAKAEELGGTRVMRLVTGETESVPAKDAGSDACASTRATACAPKG